MKIVAIARELGIGQRSVFRITSSSAQASGHSLSRRYDDWVRFVMCARYAAADFMVMVPASVSFTISVLARRAACAV